MELKRYQAEAMDASPACWRPRSPPAPPRPSRGRWRGRPRRGCGATAPPTRPSTAAPEVPYVCLRLPTGGGKTLLAAETVRLAARALRLDPVLVLWMVPTGAILTQTVAALKNRGHAYRQRLDAAFDGAVRVLGIDEVGDAASRPTYAATPWWWSPPSSRSAWPTPSRAASMPTTRTSRASSRARPPGAWRR